jgi:PAS domain S-box-containing protein
MPASPCEQQPTTSARGLFRWCWPAWLSGLLMAACLAQAQEQPPARNRCCLVILNSQHVGYPVVEASQAGILAAVREGGMSVSDVQIEYLDLERHSSAEHRAALMPLLQARARDMKVAMVYAQGQPALDYALNEGRLLYPGAVLMTNVRRFANVDRLQGRRMVHMPWRPDYVGTLRLARAAMPLTKRAIVVVGGSVADEPYSELARAELAPLESQLQIEYTDRLTYAEMLARVKQAGPDTVVLLAPYFGDAHGVNKVPVEVANVLGDSAPVPVFALADSYLRHAVVGGSILNTEAYGKRAGEVAIDYLRGKLRLQQQVTRIEPDFVATINWPQLKRWHIDPDRLPANAVFRDRPPTLWDQYRAQVLAVGGAFVLMALMMLALAIQARKRRLAEQVAQASEARAKVLTEAAPEAIVTYDIDAGRVVDANANALRLFGCTLAELIDGGFDHLYRATQPDGLPARESRTRAEQRVLAGEVVEVERVVVREDLGEEIQCEARLVLLPHAGQHIMRATYTDVSARKAMESALYFVAQRAAAGPQGQGARARELLDFVGQTFGFDHAMLLGCTETDTASKSESESETRTGAWAGAWAGSATSGGAVQVLQAMAGQDALEVQAADAQALRDSAALAGPGARIVVDGARQRWPANALLAQWQAESLLWVPLWDAQGRPLGDIVATGQRALLHPERVRSVMQVLAVRAAQELEGQRTAAAQQRHQQELEHKVAERTGALAQANAELEGARDAAEAATRAKSEFLANMSHEIRTPMNAILGMTQLAMRGPLEAKQRSYLDKTILAAGSLLGIINDILDFSKIEAGKLELERRPFDLAQVVHDVASLLGPRAADKGLSLRIAIDAAVPAGLAGDALRLNQVLMNLCGNAIKFTNHGEIVVAVALLARTGPRAELEVSVTDQGIGMTAEQVERLFQAFNQADNSHARRFGGTGLGLAISKQLVELMGGQIRVESRAGRGSRFSFTAQFDVADGLAGQQAAPGLRGQRLLVIDAHADWREEARAVLDSLGMRAVLVASVDEALALMRNADAAAQGFGIVLLDQALAMADGARAAQRIRTLLGPATPVRIVLVSAAGPAAAVDDALRAQGFDASLPQSFSASQIVDTLMGLLRPSRASAASVGPVARGITGMRVLLVEDNDFNQEVASHLLGEEAGVLVTIASNGEEALQRLREQDFEAVLMDIQMPGMDGYQTTARVRAEPRWRGLPIIAMTAHATQQDRERCLAAGMNDFVSKPFDFDVLCATLARWRGAGAVAAAAPGAAAVPATAAGPVPGQALPGVDTEAGLRYCNGSAKLYERVLRSFLDGQAGVLQTLGAALAASDLGTAERIVHTLKSNAGTIGAMALAQAARRAEQHVQAARESGETVGLDDPAVQGLLGPLEDVLAGLRARWGSP